MAETIIENGIKNKVSEVYGCGQFYIMMENINLLVLPIQ